MAGVVTLIHIYVTPLKRLLQAMLGAGAAGAAYLAWHNPGVPLPAVVAEDPGTVWLVGPAFAALTGVCFKEVRVDRWGWVLCAWWGRVARREGQASVSPRACPVFEPASRPTDCTLLPAAAAAAPTHRRSHLASAFPLQGVCYRKQESFALSLLLPTLLLGHLSGLLPEAGEKGLAAVATALLLLFAARKYTQPVREDIGGKSVGDCGWVCARCVV